VSDTLAGLLGWALIIGLIAWWWVDRRKRRAAIRTATAPPAVGVPPVAPAPGPVPESASPTAGMPAGRHFSVGEFVVLPFILAFLLLVVSAHLHDVWGTVWSVVFLLIVVGMSGAAAWDLVQGMRRLQPDPLPPWLSLMVLFGYGLVPLAGWYALIFAGRLWGVALPLAPAALFGAAIGWVKLKEGA
jgi:hypothetical protein